MQGAEQQQFHRNAQRAEQQRVGNQLGENGQVHGIARELQQRPGRPVLEFRGQRIGNDQQDAHRQDAHQDHVVQVIGVAGGRVADVVRIQHERLDAGHDFPFAHALGPKNLPLDRAVRQVHHEQHVLIGQGTADDRVHSVHVHAHPGAPERLYVPVEVLRNHHVGRYPPGFHLPPRLGDGGEADGPAQLRGVQLPGEVPGGGTAVQVHHPDGQVFRQSFPEERQEEQGRRRHHAHRAQQIDRPPGPEAQLAPDD